jgi:hypothetical protein
LNPSAHAKRGYLVAVAVIGTLQVPSVSFADGGGWPIAPVAADHPVGNTLGEFLVNQSGKYYQHAGIDILATPYPDPSAEFAIVKASGVVDWVNMSPGGQDNYVRIFDSGSQRKYIYHHLEYSMLSLPLQLRFNNMNPANRDDASFWPPMSAGEPIAQIHDSFACNVDHLHFEVIALEQNGPGIQVNPMTGIEPKPDAVAPQVVDVFVAKRGDDEWHEVEVDASAGGCSVVSGDVDVIADISDQDDGGFGPGEAAGVNVFAVQWRACKQGVDECDWTDAYRFDEMKAAWTDSSAGLAVQNFSVVNPWVSVPEAWLRSENSCPVEQQGQAAPANKTFMILTSPSAGGPWKTGSNRYGNGKYELTVRAMDIAGNLSAPRSKLVCVRN